MKKINYKTNIFFIAIFMIAFTLALPNFAFAAPGDLDPTFGIGGKVVDGSVYEFYDVAIQPDGKIVAVGGLAGIAVSRYNPDGSPDTTFGGTGRVLIDRYGLAIDVAIQPDGKIVVALRNPDGDVYGELLRLNSDGSLDTSFGTNGIVVGLFLPSVAATLPDGKLLIDQATNLLRFNANGSVDSSFSLCRAGVGASVYPYNRIESVIQADGKILTVFTSGGSSGFGVYRCNANGTLDTGFGSGGVVITPISSGAAQSIAIQLDGKFVVAGQSRSSKNTEWKPTIVRYNPNGSLDTGFGTGGIVTAPSTGITYWLPPFADLFIQADGNIVVSTTIGSGSALARYNPNGSPDTTFGGADGISTVSGFDHPNGLALDSHSRAVVVGSSGNSAAIARILLAPRQANADFDGDGRSDISVFRPSDSVWYLNQSTNGFSATKFGLSTDRITPADYDGDGKTDIAVFRDGTWYLLRSTEGFLAVQFGLANDIPQPADFDGDGQSELAVYRSGNWYTLNLQNNQFNAVQFGLSTDNPVVGDYDGDTRADFAVFRDGNWYLFQSTQGFSAIQFGLPNDKLVQADYDGDGKTDLSVYRDGIWYLLQSAGGFTGFQFGLATDVPTPADYDGDGRADAAVYRDGNWYLRQSKNGFSAQQFGLPTDKPVQTAYSP